MKFANYVFNARGVNNLGDNMQLLAIDYIYEQMGIDLHDVVYINKNDMPVYDGEYVILPVTMPLVDYTPHGICGRFSDRIIPVFLGLTLAVDSLLPEEVEYYRRFEPIGCRDERTLCTLRKYGIQAYLHGCITATLPLREEKGKVHDKVYIVNVAEDIIPIIPDELKKGAIFLSHFHSEALDDPKELMRSYYQQYKDNARLVITGLLHCTVPCMAAGIPVISLHNFLSYRYGWLEKLLTLYTKEDFERIDWNPKPVYYEVHKARLLNVTTQRLKDAYTKYATLYDLSWFYEHRERKSYTIDAFEGLRRYIESRFKGDGAGQEYAIWGITQMSTMCVDYMQAHFPQARLTHVYDAFRTIEFHGVLSQKPEKIREAPNEIILVTTNGALSMAEALFAEIKKPTADYVIWQPYRSETGDCTI